MFEHMQTLPIRYFDQNTNGSIMSLYTNDTDTLRQMISQSIPQALMSFFTIIVTFISMLILSPLLTILAVLIIGLMIFVTKKIGGNSGKYFVRQQKSLADVTGFVEERMNGQRVVKVFNHERKSEEEFDKLNEALFESAAQANTFANMMGPVIGNIGNLQFVLVLCTWRIPFYYGKRRDHSGSYGILSAVYKELYTAVYAGGAAV